MSKNKSETELRDKVKMNQQKAFLEEYGEAIKPVVEKYSMQVVPVVRNLSTEFKVHYEAAFAVQKFTKEEVTVQKADETLDTQSEAEPGTDNNDKTSQE